jgi:hypothetical protein
VLNPPSFVFFWFQSWWWLAVLAEICSLVLWIYVSIDCLNMPLFSDSTGMCHLRIFTLLDNYSLHFCTQQLCCVCLRVCCVRVRVCVTREVWRSGIAAVVIMVRW